MNREVSLVRRGASVCAVAHRVNGDAFSPGDIQIGANACHPPDLNLSPAAEPTVITVRLGSMAASQLMSEIHNAKQRMPAILTREDRVAWLRGTPDEAFAAVKQSPHAHLVATPVNTRVNAPKNNDAALIEPLAA
jgi:hypothetical protein